MKNDKKKNNNNIKFILLKDIGKAYIEDNVCYDNINLTIKESKVTEAILLYQIIIIIFLIILSAFFLPLKQP